MPFDTTPDWRHRRREKILEAASTLFAQRPYQAVQMDEVAREAVVGKATLYRYFSSKEDLYVESVERSLLLLEERLHAPDLAEPVRTLSDLVRVLIETFDQQLPGLRVLGGENSDLAERIRRLFRQRTARIAAALRQVLEAGMAGRRFRPLDVDMVPLLIIGVVRGAVMMGGDHPQERVVDAVLDLVLHAVGPGDGGAHGSTGGMG